MQFPSVQKDSAYMLRLRDVGVTYPGGVVALQSATIDFFPQQFSVLIGLSGAGKSTLLRSLNFLVKPASGEIVSSEFGVLGASRTLRQHRRQTALIFQQHQLIERHTALSNVLTGRLGYHGTLRSFFPLPKADLELALHCLERVGLADKSMTRVDQLSGGQKQRVGIARALAQQPSMMLADEPVASLDPATSEMILELLWQVCREDGISAIVSLHQLEYAQRFADRIIGLAGARIIFDGTAQELTDDKVAAIYARRPPEPAAPVNTRNGTVRIGRILTPKVEMRA